MSIEQLPDIEAIEYLDFEFAPPCEIVTNPSCDKEAEWKAVLKCCGHILLMCNEHMDKKYEEFAKKSEWLHKKCGTKIPPGNPYISIERL